VVTACIPAPSSACVCKDRDALLAAARVESDWGLCSMIQYIVSCMCVFGKLYIPCLSAVVDRYWEMHIFVHGVWVSGC
jgi:hypothetical protein